MASTRYIIAATPAQAAKTVSTAKAARNEADARAEVEQVDVEVRTQSTDKLVYTAEGAPAAVTVDIAAPITAHPADGGPSFTIPASEADLAATATVEAMYKEIKEEVAAAQITSHPAPAAKDPQRKAPCGCLVETIIASGQHGKDCATVAAQVVAAEAVKRDPAPKAPRTPRAPRTGGGSTGRREGLGASAVDGWELLYDKPAQHAQVGRREGKYALICTTHKTVRELTKLVEERTLRAARGWCKSCTH